MGTGARKTDRPECGVRRRPWWPFPSGLGFGWLGPILAALLIGALAGSLSWVAGPSRGLLLVGHQGVLPPLFQCLNRAGVQAPIMLAQAAIVSVLSVLFVVIHGISDAFWVLQAMTAILYLSMYLLMFAAAWRLRVKQPDAPRLFRVPALPLVASVGMIAAVAGIVIGLIPPAKFKEGPPTLYALLLIAGVALLAATTDLHSAQTWLAQRGAARGRRRSRRAAAPTGRSYG